MMRMLCGRCQERERQGPGGGLDMVGENQVGMTPGVLTCDTGSEMGPFTQEEEKIITTDRAHSVPSAGLM